jgi:elongation factor 1 alpha-like protein
MKFVPVGAFAGVNLVDLKSKSAETLRQWYRGPTLVELLGKIADYIESAYI